MYGQKDLTHLAYRITYITMEDQNLQFETQIAITSESGVLALWQAPTLPSERKELRELLLQEQP
ncbi:type III secretion system co-regulatory protein PtrC [Pseudomonas schmalbachii]|uniref:Uncharacterized protein n=1 Tax=Pseudomonas schmalbachii TaxID=2816993 RepID=A0ABS3TJQ1_9PSED|nr:type III secretion system co-regulatory protein PtrC [Pseudomonas schmalbachii]MBO3273890.1 hypothetical protein [Pseudomonas schmalbachii]